MDKDTLTATFNPTKYDFDLFDYDKNLKPNKFFDDIEAIDHTIDVPIEYRDFFKGHICMCGKLIVSSFLPEYIREQYHDYTTQKGKKDIAEHLVDGITKTVDDMILKRIQREENKFNYREFLQKRGK